MGKNLVLAGGGHAHMMLLANIGKITEKGHRVTVIQPSEHHYYSGMGPGMLSTHYSPDDIRFNTRYVVERQNGEFICDKVSGFDPVAQKVMFESGQSCDYDVLSCNVGSYVPFPRIEGDRSKIYSAKPIERLLEAQQKILTHCNSPKISIGIVGGGPAAIEIAGNAYHLASTTSCKNIEVTLYAGRQIMKEFSAPIQRIVRNTFEKFGISINENGYVSKIEDNTIILENGEAFSPDILFLATGVKPTPVFKKSGIQSGPDGGLLVNEFLQSKEYPNIFGGGDCIYHEPRPLAKVGVYAVRQNPVLLNNVIASLDGNQLTPFDPGGNYLLIFNLGKGIGALEKGPFKLGGKISFIIKDYIDRKFMREFQALEE